MSNNSRGQFRVGPTGTPWGSPLLRAVVASAVATCFAASDPVGLATRTAAIEKAFGYSALPTKSKPDYIIPVAVNPSQHPGGQTTGLTPNTTVLKWTITEGGVTLNATVYWTLNTSGTALADYPYAIEPTPGQSSGQAPGNGDTGPMILPQRHTDTLVLYHNGHETHWLGAGAKDPLCVRPVNETTGANSRERGRPGADPLCWINYDTTLGWLNELGYDAMEFNMPLRGPNNNGSIGTISHSYFEPLEQAGHYPLRFFVEPVFLAINFAKSLGYKRIAMVGLSGGGWTTTIASALDPRIGLSIPTAGSLPFFMRTEHPGDPYHDLGDFEQSVDRPVYSACNYTCMYVLAGLEQERQQLQILHEQDPCCFRAGRPNGHAEILGYNRNVQSQIDGWMCTAATEGNVHEVNLRDKTIIATALDQWDSGFLNLKQSCYSLPFNVLTRW
eukprot:m.133454 g.133454  ORF g.133454 m.133454 type:complete len:444 (-) comp13837_c0_seq1:1123-2454(-)